MGLGEHRHVTGIKLYRLCAHALRGETFEIRMDGAVLGADDIPARLCSPRDTIVLLIEEVRHRYALCRPYDLLFRLRRDHHRNRQFRPVPACAGTSSARTVFPLAVSIAFSVSPVAIQILVLHMSVFDPKWTFHGWRHEKFIDLAF